MTSGVSGRPSMKGINIRFAEKAGETDLIFRRQFLVPEKDNLVIQEGITDSGGIAVRQFTAQINAFDLGAKRARNCLYLHRVWSLFLATIGFFEERHILRNIIGLLGQVLWLPFRPMFCEEITAINVNGTRQLISGFVTE